MSEATSGKAPQELSGYCKFCRVRIRPSLIIGTDQGIDPRMIQKLPAEQREIAQFQAAIAEHLYTCHLDQYGMIQIMAAAFSALLYTLTVETEHPAIAQGIANMRRNVSGAMNGPQPAGRAPQSPGPGEQKGS